MKAEKKNYYAFTPVSITQQAWLAGRALELESMSAPSHAGALYS